MCRRPAVSRMPVCEGKKKEGPGGGGGSGALNELPSFTKTFTTSATFGGAGGREREGGADTARMLQ